MEGILAAQGSKLDRRLVVSQLESIRDVIEFDPIRSRLKALFQKHPAG
jgi:hypothetical protein